MLQLAWKRACIHIVTCVWWPCGKGVQASSRSWRQCLTDSQQGHRYLNGTTAKNRFCQQPVSLGEDPELGLGVVVITTVNENNSLALLSACLFHPHGYSVGLRVRSSTCLSQETGRLPGQWARPWLMGSMWNTVSSSFGSHGISDSCSLDRVWDIPKYRAERKGNQACHPLWTVKGTQRNALALVSLSPGSWNATLIPLESSSGKLLKTSRLRFNCSETLYVNLSLLTATETLTSTTGIPSPSLGVPAEGTPNYQSSRVWQGWLLVVQAGRSRSHLSSCWVPVLLCPTATVTFETMPLPAESHSFH